jgi:septum formation protein
MLILASKSKIRQQILSAAGVTFAVQETSVDETNLQNMWGELSAEVLAARLAEAKALSVSTVHPGTLVIGCDQTAHFEGRTLHKAKLVALVQSGHILCTETHSVQLTMRHFSESFLDTYMQQAREALLSSIGGYHIEGLGLQLFDKIEGDYFTVLGLPLLPLLAKLREIGELEI